MEEKKKIKKPMAIWKLILTDILLAAVCIGIFLLYHYIIPMKSSNSGTVISQIDESNNFKLPSTEDSTSEEETVSEEETTKRSSKRGSGNTGNTGTSVISSDSGDSSGISNADKTTEVLENYSDSNITFDISKVELGSGNDKITYYVADIYVTNVKYLLTAFSNGTYGKNIREDIVDMANDNNAVLAVSGDFYGNSEDGVVIRNGVLYRSTLNDADICVLFTDGSLKTYSPDVFNADEVIAQGAWQAWTFGPAMLDGNGNVLSSFNTTSYLNKENPRCAIGYIAEGHYVLVVVDGRDDGYSKGATLTELAQIMADEGCKTAYNLDGGKSAAMVYKGEFVNQPVEGGRTLSDIIYIGGN